MEAINRLLQQLQDITNTELDLLNAQQSDEERIETIDTLKLNTAAKISEIKLLIGNCERLGLVRFDNKNLVKFYRSEPIVVIMDYVKHPNTIRAHAAYSLTWNINHKLNTVQPNILSTKNAETSQMLAILAVITQLEVLHFGAAKVLTNNRQIKTKMDNLAENVRMINAEQTNTIMHVMQLKIFEKMNQTKIKLEILHPNDVSELSSTYTTLKTHAREKLREFMSKM